MTIAKCKGCGEIIITTEHLKDKRNTFCITCIMENFVESKVDNYIICKKCGIAVSRLQEANEHLQNCSYNLKKLSEKKDV